MTTDDDMPPTAGAGGAHPVEPDQGFAPPPVPSTDAQEEPAEESPAVVLDEEPPAEPDPDGPEQSEASAGDEPEPPAEPAGAEPEPPAEPAGAEPAERAEPEAAKGTELPVEPVVAEQEAAEPTAPNEEAAEPTARSEEPVLPTAEPPRVDPVEPGTPDPAAAVTAAPVVDPVAGQDAVEPEPDEPDHVPDVTAPAEATAPEATAAEATAPEATADEATAVEATAPEATAVETAPGAEVADRDPEELAEQPADQLLGDDADAAVPAFRSARALLSALVAVVVLLAALTAFLAVRSVSTRGGGGIEDARQDGLAAARSAARVVFSYDYRHLGKDFNAGKAVTTGEFAKEYARTTSKLVDDVAARYKAVVLADISEAAVVTASEKQVVALVFLNQQSTSTLNAGSKITQSRLEMTMVRRGDRWLVSRIRAF